MIVLVANGKLWGGTERHVLDLAVGLRTRGFRPAVLLACDAYPASVFSRSGLSVQVVDRRGSALSYILRMRRRLAALQPMLIHVHGGRMPALAAKWAGVPVIVETQHGLGRDETRRRGRGGRRLPERITRGLPDATIVVCSADLQTFSDSSGRRPTYYVPNGVPVETVAPDTAIDDEDGGAEETVRFGFLGRFTTQKGLMYLLEALGEEQRPFSLDLCGEGPLEDDLRRRVELLGLSGRVRFRGFVSSVARYLAEWDVLVMPSLWEGCPYAVLEALAGGRPVLGTRVGGMEELISDGQWGWLADPANPASIRRALARIPWSRGRLRTAGEKGRIHVKDHFTVEGMVDGVVEVYRKTCARKGLELPVRLESAR